MGFYSNQNGAAASGESEREYSVTTGVVKENWDKEYPGMIKVEYFLGEKGKNVTGWIPVMIPYGGKEYGYYALPEVESVVVIAFERGDRNCPIVIGALWTKVNPLPKETADEKNTKKRFLTRGGCELTFDDTDGKQKIEIKSPKELQIILDDENEKILLKDKSGDNQMEMDCKNGKFSVQASRKMEFQVGGELMLALDGSSKSVQVKGNKIDLNAKQAFNAKGANTQIGGNMLTVKGDSTTRVESGTMLEMKGAMVKIN